MVIQPDLSPSELFIFFMFFFLFLNDDLFCIFFIFIFIFLFLDGETEGGDTPSMRECASPSVQKTPTHTVS